MKKKKRMIPLIKHICIKNYANKINECFYNDAFVSTCVTTATRKPFEKNLEQFIAKKKTKQALMKQFSFLL